MYFKENQLAIPFVVAILGTEFPKYKLLVHEKLPNMTEYNATLNKIVKLQFCLTFQKEGGEESASCSPLSPGSLKLPSLSSWDLPTSTRSPALYAPPDMNSKFLMRL